MKKLSDILEDEFDKAITAQYLTSRTVKGISSMKPMTDEEVIEKDTELSQAHYRLAEILGKIAVK